MNKQKNEIKRALIVLAWIMIVMFILFVAIAITAHNIEPKPLDSIEKPMNTSSYNIVINNTYSYFENKAIITHSETPINIEKMKINESFFVL